MPGYVIHLAIAEQYLKKHTNKNEQYNEFIEGVIFPDSVTDKSKTHYGPQSSQSNLYNFLKENEIDNSFKKGYFLHLLTDYLFYNYYIDTISKDIYNDYDLTNAKLIKDYKVIIPTKVKEKVFFKETGELKILSISIVEKLIENVSNMDIEETANEVRNNPEKWTTMRKLKNI